MKWSTDKRFLGAASIHEGDGRGTLRSGTPRKQQLMVAMITPVAAQALQGECRQYHEAVLASLAAADMDLGTGAVDIADPQSQGFAQTQAQAIGRQQERPVAPLATRPDDPCDLIDADHIGQRVHHRRLEHVHPRPLPLQDVFVEELQSAALDLHQAPRSLVDQRGEVGLEVFRVQSIRTAIEVCGYPAQRSCVTIDRLRCLALELQCSKMLRVQCVKTGLLR
jgi:hypothetical protein